MRRILNQAANAAAKSKGTIFEIVYRRLVSRLGHNQTIGAIAIGFVASSGSFSIAVCVTKSEVPR
jgi:hypothetical protein